MVYCFNSLQTGKCIQSHLKISLSTSFIGVSIPFKRESVFKESCRFSPGSISLKVSIPFKRESVFKAVRDLRRPWPRLPSFQFPSNGKVYSKSYGYPFLRRWRFWHSFNSLQTGKCIQSPLPSDGHFVDLFVSIPFKRESVFKVKEYGLIKAAEMTVSIPFKRESVFKELLSGNICFSRKFQFPSNGKVYSKKEAREYETELLNSVSIPFKRESVFKVTHETGSLRGY